MLLSLHVKNLALIRECEVEFGEGLNILTGETGAGKSILLGSVQLALGAKMSKDMIREDASYGLVELLFQIDDENTKQRLGQLEIYPEEGQVLISRRVTETRSVCRINGETCTMARLRQAAACLLDIHGQHEHQSLLDRGKQLEILDEFGGERLLAAREQTSLLYRCYSDIKKELSSLSMDEEQRKREMAFLQFEIGEIEKAQLISGEDEQLEAQFRKLNNSRKIMESLQQVHFLTGYETAGDAVGQGLRLLSSVAEYDSQLENLLSVLTDIDGLLNDFNRELSAYLDSLTFDEEDFQQAQQRLDLLNNLKARYGNTLEAIFSYAEKQQAALEKLENYQQRKQELEQQLQTAAEELEQSCEELTVLRKEAALCLQQQVIEELRDLNFLDVSFQIDFRMSDGFTAKGRDEIEYQISTNPGEPLRPLGKVVSGGELSRIMLAVKTLLADKDQVDTLIFDEIDTGISGRTAQKVSEKMARIGRKRQVLCITHLPQIASMADQHFVITKQVVNDQTVTEIALLDESQSVEELARLLGGAQITDKVLESAREMKALAQNTKKEK